MLNKLCLFILSVVLIAPLAQAQTMSTSILPKDFNPNTCEADREPPPDDATEDEKSAYRVRSQSFFYTCDQLRIAYKWEPTQQAILDTVNGLPPSSSVLSDASERQKTGMALARLSELAMRVINDYRRPPPELEKRDLIGDYLDNTKRAFVERGWDAPGMIPMAFMALQTKLNRAYVDPVEGQVVINVAQERGMALFQLSQEASRSMIQAQPVAANQAAQEVKKQEAAALAEAGFTENVKVRAKKWPGFVKIFLTSLGIVLVVLILMRNFIPSPQHFLMLLGAATGALFVAQVAAGWISIITGIPNWAGLLLTIVIYGIVYVLFREKINSMFPMSEKRGTHGSASWSTLNTAISAGRLFERGMVSADSYGFALGKFPKAPQNLDPRLRYMGHVVTCAPTGSGKGIGAVIPTLLEYPGSTLVLDIKGENYAVTARARAQMGHEVYLIDPFKVTGADTVGFNPLDGLDLNDPDIVGHVAALVDTLVVIGSSQDDSSAHFNDSAKDLIKGVIAYVKNMNDTSKRTLAEMRRILSLPLQADPGHESIIQHLEAMQDDPALAFGIPARSANGFLSKESREASGVLSTALRHTSFLDDPRIAAALSQSDFSFADLKRKPMTVYVVMPPDRLAAQVRFMRALVGSALAAITATAERPTYNVLFLLDEFAQLGRMQAIEDAISLVRGYGARFWLMVQDLSQLKEVYPKWQTFLANSAKQFFGTADYETAKYVSDMLGQETITYRTHGDSSSSSLQGGSSGSSTSEQLTARALLSPDEVMRYGPHRPIVLIQGERPYSLARLNYLSDPEYSGLADSNPFHR